MCELRAAPNPTPVGQRRKLWEVRPDLHCSILGTCLSYADLLKIGRRAGYVPKEQASEYEVHKYFVHCAEEPDRLARLMQKMLDAKYRAVIHASRNAQCGASLEAFWSDALARGDIPGPYWALVTHPLVTDELLVRAFGEVHMLSHLTGAANRADAKRLTSLEATLAETRRSLAAQVAEQRRAAAQHADEVAGLERRLKTAEADEAARAAAEARLSELESGAAHRALVRANATLGANLEASRRACESVQARYGDLEQEVSELRRANREAAASLEALRNECSALEAIVQADNIDSAEPARTTRPAIDLCGRRIAYVGGRASTVGHFRAVVEGLNGRFSHHDGGVDDNIGRGALPRRLRKPWRLSQGENILQTNGEALRAAAYRGLVVTGARSPRSRGARQLDGEGEERGRVPRRGLGAEASTGSCGQVDRRRALRSQRLREGEEGGGGCQKRSAGKQRNSFQASRWRRGKARPARPPTGPKTSDSA